MIIYFISGIGADERMFTHIRPPEGYQAAYIRWIPPQDNESLGIYASRLTAQIDTSQPFVLIGLSLGGIMAVEMAKRVTPQCTIIISSIPLSAHLPPYFRAAGKLGLGKVVPPMMLKAATSLKHFFTMKTPANRKIIQSVIWSGDDKFISWALNAVLEWNNTEVPTPLYHVHGTRDEVFPIGFTHPTHIIPKAGHMFLLSRPEEVNNLLRSLLPPKADTFHPPLLPV
jgi:pimeloyl-ACP methyl ester carboxylesterase